MLYEKQEEAPAPCSKPTDLALVTALEMEWRDHFQTRTQTWRTLEIEAFLLLGMLGADWYLQSLFATGAIAAFLIVLILIGLSVTNHHREVQAKKFAHIYNLERKLALHGEDLIVHTSPPEKKSFSTMSFIKFGHYSFLIFVLAVFIQRLDVEFPDLDILKRVAQAANGIKALISAA